MSENHKGNVIKTQYDEGMMNSKMLPNDKSITNVLYLIGLKK